MEQEETEFYDIEQNNITLLKASPFKGLDAVFMITSKSSTSIKQRVIFETRD